MVDSVKEKSKGKNSGFQEGDIIIGVGQSEIKNLKDLEQALKQVNKKNLPKFGYIAMVLRLCLCLNKNNGRIFLSL